MNQSFEKPSEKRGHSCARKRIVLASLDLSDRKSISQLRHQPESHVVTLSVRGRYLASRHWSGIFPLGPIHLRVTTTISGIPGQCASELTLGIPPVTGNQPKRVTAQVHDTIGCQTEGFHTIVYAQEHNVCILPNSRR